MEDIKSIKEFIDYNAGWPYNVVKIPVYSSFAFNIINRAYFSYEVPYSYPTKRWVSFVGVSEDNAVSFAIYKNSYKPQKNKIGPSFSQIASIVKRLVNEAALSNGDGLVLKEADYNLFWKGVFPKISFTKDELSILTGFLSKGNANALIRKYGEDLVSKTIGKPLDPIKSAAVSSLEDKLFEMKRKLDNNNGDASLVAAISDLRKNIDEVRGCF